MPARDRVITFKAEPSVEEALRAVPNRSAFIRQAVLAALENTCPLCQGEGFLSPEQREHWQAFAATHQLRKCQECHAFHLVCACESHAARETDPGGAAHDA
jgi:hypothetical protein